MQRINLFVFAAHHLSSNVAAERFKGLLKYLDPDKYRIFVFARQASPTAPGRTELDQAGVHVIALPGACVGSESSARSSLLTLASAFARSLPNGWNAASAMTGARTTRRNWMRGSRNPPRTRWPTCG